MKRISLATLATVATLTLMAQTKITQTAGRQQLGDFAPEFAHLNDDILPGTRWLEPAHVHQ